MSTPNPETDERMVTILRLPITEQRPGIPSSHIIFNAPRPMIGSIEWSGKFMHGVLYAALDVTLPGADNCFLKNVQYDGWVVEYVTQDDIDAWIEAQCAKRKCTREKLDDAQWIDYYWDKNRTYQEPFSACWARLTAGSEDIL